MRNENVNRWPLQVVSLLFVGAFTGVLAHGQPRVAPPPRLPAQTIERSIARDETHVYEVVLKRDEFIQVRADQKGIDVAMSIHSADGTRLAKMDGPSGREGFDTISYVSGEIGSYFVNVRRAEVKDNPASGTYAVTLVTHRAPTAADRRRVEVEKVYTEAMEIFLEDGKERVVLAKLQEALKGWRELSDQHMADATAQALDMRGVLLALEAGFAFSSAYTEETRQKAIAKLDKAVAWFQDTGSKSQAAIGFYMLTSAISFLFDEHGKALHFARQALEVTRANGDRETEMGVLMYVGFLHTFMGNNQEAVASYEQSLTLSEQLSGGQSDGVVTGDFTILSGLGKTHMELGNKQRALEYLNRALSLSRAAGDKHGAASSLLEISRVQARSGDYESALSSGVAASQLFGELGDKSRESAALAELGEIYSGMGKEVETLRHFNGAMLLCKAATAAEEKKEKKTSLAEFFDVRILFAGADKNVNCEALVHSRLMAHWRKLGNPRYAIFHGKQSVNKYESLRQKMLGATKDFRKLYRNALGDTYRRLADILISEGRISEAEQVLAMLKEEEVYTYLRRDDKVAKELLRTVSLTDAERAALTRYDGFAEQITAIGKEFGELGAERQKFEAGRFPKQARYDELRRQLADATETFQQFLGELKAEFGKEDSRVTSVDSSLQSTLKRLRARRTAIVSTIVGERRLNIIVTTAETQRAHTVDIGEKEINRLVARFRQALTNPGIDPRGAGQELYNVLMKPIEGDLAGVRVDTILWSLDGTLRYVPTAALWDRRRGYVAERFAGAVLTLASRDTLALPVSDKKRWQALGVGVSKPVEGFSALEAVPDELDCIITDAQTSTLSQKPICRAGVMAGRKLLNEKFTLTAFESSLGRYPVLHVASHFSLNPGNDKDSFLLLGGGEPRRYTVENLRGVSLTEVELIVLSACNTATPGGEKANGVEIESFGVVAQKQGAKAVVATLWAVADDSTRDLMVNFYKTNNSGNLSKAEAIRRAQLAMIYGKYKASDVNTKRGAEQTALNDKGSAPSAFARDGNAPFSHPYFWSPFVLIGNWR